MPPAERALHLAGGLMLHPIALSAVAALWVNDHHLKQACPGVLTGKLSDVAGMVVFPLFLTGVLEVLALLVGRRVRIGPRGMTVAAVATGVAFATIQLSTTGAAAYRWAFGVRWLVEGWVVRGASELPRVQHTMDPTDLVALPGLVVPVWLAARRRRVSR